MVVFIRLSSRSSELIKEKLRLWSVCVWEHRMGATRRDGDVKVHGRKSTRSGGRRKIESMYTTMTVVMTMSAAASSLSGGGVLWMWCAKRGKQGCLASQTDFHTLRISQYYYYYYCIIRYPRIPPRSEL